MLKEQISKLKLVAIGVIALFAVIVVLQNTQPVERGPVVRNVNHRLCDRGINRGTHRIQCETAAARVSRSE